MHDICVVGVRIFDTKRAWQHGVWAHQSRSCIRTLMELCSDVRKLKMVGRVVWMLQLVLRCRWTATGVRQTRAVFSPSTVDTVQRWNIRQHGSAFKWRLCWQTAAHDCSWTRLVHSLLSVYHCIQNCITLTEVRLLAVPNVRLSVWYNRKLYTIVRIFPVIKIFWSLKISINYSWNFYQEGHPRCKMCHFHILQVLT